MNPHSPSVHAAGRQSGGFWGITPAHAIKAAVRRGEGETNDNSENLVEGARGIGRFARVRDCVCACRVGPDRPAQVTQGARCRGGSRRGRGAEGRLQQGISQACRARADGRQRKEVGGRAGRAARTRGAARADARRQEGNCDLAPAGDAGRRRPGGLRGRNRGIPRRGLFGAGERRRHAPPARRALQRKGRQGKDAGEFSEVRGCDARRRAR